MTDYLLFIDTEASGLPGRWDLPYSATGNWPYSVQVSWLIYTKDGQEVKQENYFINDDDFKITPSAFKIHGITTGFLKNNGQSRKEVMTKLHEDVLYYRPLIVGHFMEFDLHMINLDFLRSGIENPVRKEMTFCTMVSTTNLVKNPRLKFFKLGQLYETLFSTILMHQHDALVDAKATAACFFELLKRGEIDDEKIATQQKEAKKTATGKQPAGCTIPVLVIIFLTLLINYFL